MELILVFAEPALSLPKVYTYAAEKLSSVVSPRSSDQLERIQQVKLCDCEDLALPMSRAGRRKSWMPNSISLF